MIDRSMSPGTGQNSGPQSADSERLLPCVLCALGWNNHLKLKPGVQYILLVRKNPEGQLAHKCWIDAHFGYLCRLLLLIT